MFSQKKNRNKSPYLSEQQKNIYIPRPLLNKKIEKPSLFSNLISGITHGFSFGAGSELAHQGMKKIFNQEQPNEPNEPKQQNHILQEDICNQIKQEYNKCMIYTGDCKELNDALQNICKIYQ